MAIRYNANLNKDIQRVVRNFNSKITRLEKINNKLGIYDLPEKISVKGIKGQVTTRAELNKVLKNLGLFSKRGIEESIQTESGLMSKYEYELIKRQQKSLKTYYTKRIKEYEKLSPYIAGKKQKGTLLTLGDEYLDQLKENRRYLDKDIKSLSKEALENFKQSLIRSSQARLKTKTLYSNYLDDMMLRLGYSVGYDNEKLDYIKSRLKELTPQQFDKALRIESALQTVTDYYADIHDEKTLQRNINDIQDKYDLLYESIDKIVEQAKLGYNE